MTVLRNGALIACLLAVAALAQAQDGGDGVSRPRLSDERVVLHTDAGDIVVAFYPDVAPLHMAQLLKLMRWMRTTRPTSIGSIQVIWSSFPT